MRLGNKERDVRRAISDIMARLSKPSGNQSAFYWFHKGLGLVYLSAIFPLFFQIEALLGGDGLLPAKELLRMAYAEKGAFLSFMQFPSLYHAAPFNMTLYVLVFLGCLGGLMLLAGYRVFWGALLAWLSFLSITSIGGDFFIIIIDLFLAEVGFLALFSTYCIQRRQPIPKLVGFAFRLLNFRLWFCMGINKFYMPVDVWSHFTFFDHFFQAQPMPSPAAALFNQAPQFLKTVAIVSLGISEVLVPFFVFGKKLWRLIAFWTFILISFLIQLNGNYGYFNVLSVVLAIVILNDGDLAFLKVKRLPLDSLKHGLPRLAKGLLVLQIVLQLCYCVYVFDPKPKSNQNHFNYLFTTHQPESRAAQIVLEPFRWLEYWRICNPYGVFKSIPYYHAELRLSGSNDSLNWQPYEFKYLPSGNTDYLGFYAPYYPRLDHLFFYEGIAAQNYLWNPLNRFYTGKNAWVCRFVDHLLSNDQAVTKLLKQDPFKDSAPPKFIKAEVFRLSLSKEKGKNWDCAPTGISKVYSTTTRCTQPLVTFEEAKRTIFSVN